jgi:hypothetical protein
VDGEMNSTVRIKFPFKLLVRMKEKPWIGFWGGVGDGRSLFPLQLVYGTMLIHLCIVNWSKS